MNMYFDKIKSVGQCICQCRRAGVFLDFPSTFLHPLIFPWDNFCVLESPVQIRISSRHRVFSAVLCFPFCWSSKFFYVMSLGEMLQIPWTITDTALSHPEIKRIERPRNKMHFDKNIGGWPCHGSGLFSRGSGVWQYVEVPFPSHSVNRARHQKTTLAKLWLLGSCQNFQ